MAITTLDPKTALIVIDLQKGIVGMSAAHPGTDVVKRAAALAEAFRRHRLPVVLVNVDSLAPAGPSSRRRTSQPFPPTGRNSSRN
jgi:nicotinamidase-related amidase